MLGSNLLELDDRSCGDGKATCERGHIISLNVGKCRQAVNFAFYVPINEHAVDLTCHEI
jgi:hypothetical protein